IFYEKKYLIPFFALLGSTAVNAQQNLPFNESFIPVDGSSGTFPTGWINNTDNPVVVLNSDVNAYSGTDESGSAMFNLYNSAGLTELTLTSPTLDNEENTLKLTFDFAAAVYHQGPAFLPQTYGQDRFQILASTDGGTTFTLVKDYLIGDTGELNTGGVKINQIYFSPADD